MLASGWLLATAAHAQADSTAWPPQITVAGVAGERITRTTRIRASETISAVQSLATDLRSTDGKVIPAAQIAADSSAGRIEAGGMLTITTVFDLNNVASGEYQGELLVNYDNGVMTLPVTVQVKHRSFWAFLVIILGIAAGSALTYYRNRVRPYDDILIRAGRLRSQLRSDAELVDSFRRQIERQLIDVEAALQSEDLEQSRSLIGQAEDVWLRWRRDRQNWQELFAFVAELRQSIERANLPTDRDYIRKVQQQLQDIERDAAVPAVELHALQERLQVQREAIADYQIVYQQIDELLTRSRDVPELKHQAAGMQSRLDMLDPADKVNRRQLKQEIEALARQIARTTGASAEENAGVLGAGRGQTESNVLAGIPMVPSFVTISTSEASGNQAIRRQAIIWWASAIFILFLLTLVGLGQLYGNNPTFGADFWADYATLLAWGFGIEASRSAIIGLSWK